MALSEAEVLAHLDSLRMRENLFEDLTKIEIFEPRLGTPDPFNMLRAELVGSTLKVRMPDASTLHLTLNQVSSDEGLKDVGIALPNASYFVSHEDRPVGSGRFPAFRVDLGFGAARFRQIPIDMRAQELAPAELANIVRGRGVLFYNNTDRPEPLFDFMTYEIDDWKSYEILFIDLCANLARTHLSQSKVELQRIAEAARTRNGEFQKMLQGLRTKASIYYRLEGLRDFINFLTYVRWLWLTGGPGTLLSGLTLTAEQSGLIVKLAEEIVPEIEKQLAEAGHPVTLEQLVEKMDEKLREIRRGAPLLGRLEWDEVKGRTDSEIAGAVVSLVESLTGDNDKARKMLEEDMQDARRLLRIVPPWIMAIQRIVATVEQQQRDKIVNNVEYFWAVHRLKEQAATFQLVLGLGSLVFSFFCPPVSIALGIFSAVVSVNEAIFKDALSDSTLSVDDALVTQSEAREAAFWAGVDVVFAVVDVVGGFGDAAQVVKSLGRASDLAPLARTADELAEIGGEAVQDARRLERLGEAAGPDALARAAEDIDVPAARHELAEASSGQVDLSRSRRLADPPATALEAIDNATPTVRQSIEREFLPIIDADYTRHFDDAVGRGEAPMHWDHFAGDWQRNRLREIPAKQVDPPPRSVFFNSLAGPDGTVAGLLGDPGALRQRLVALLQAAGGFPQLPGFDGRFLNEFRTAVKRGASVSELDDIVQQRFLRALDEAAGRAGFPPGQGREFGLFARGVPNINGWDDNALGPLRNLFEDARIDNNALHAMLTNRSYTRYGTTPRLNMEAAVALERIRDVDGVLNRVSASNPRLFDSLVGGNRGHAFEAILVSRLLDDAERAGARITVGRRWWLNSIDEFNAAEGRNFTNVLEADILVELGDGRRILVDAKFYEKGVAINQTLDNQLAKIADGIDEGLIHNAEYWMSHHFVASREGIGNLEAFQLSADMWSGGRIHMVYDVFEGGFPRNFFDSSRFTQVSREHGVVIIPPHADLGVTGVTGPSPLPATTVTPASDALVPVAESAADLQPAVRQSDAIRSEATVSRDVRRAYIPINPYASIGRVVVSVAPREAQATQVVDLFALVKAQAGTDISGRAASTYAVGPLSDADRAQIVGAIGERTADGKSKFLETHEVVMGGEPPDLYVVAFHRADTSSKRVTCQLALYSETGRLVDTLPDQDEYLTLTVGVTVLPMTAQRLGDTVIYPLRPGSYILALRVDIEGRVLTHPKTFAVKVTRMEGT